MTNGSNPEALSPSVEAARVNVLTHAQMFADGVLPRGMRDVVPTMDVLIAAVRDDERAKYEALLQRALEALEKADVDLNANGQSYVNLETVRDLRAAIHQQAFEVLIA